MWCKILSSPVYWFSLDGPCQVTAFLCLYVPPPLPTILKHRDSSGVKALPLLRHPAEDDRSHCCACLRTDSCGNALISLRELDEIVWKCWIPDVGTSLKGHSEIFINFDDHTNAFSFPPNSISTRENQPVLPCLIHVVLLCLFLRISQRISQIRWGVREDL